MDRHWLMIGRGSLCADEVQALASQPSWRWSLWWIFQLAVPPTGAPGRSVVNIANGAPGTGTNKKIPG
ncbi:MAG: hypothetical protein JXA13_01430 [Anaerolineales bacterium]|nr:hypothetical protein [Anaerolineales bacterium]